MANRKTSGWRTITVGTNALTVSIFISQKAHST